MKHYLLVLLSIICLLPVGCIKDDWSKCDNVIIYFRYLADGDEDVLSKYMDQVDLYVFDDNNRVVDKRQYGHGQLVNSGTAPSFRLPAGHYTVVAVGNAKGRTEVVNLDSRDFETISIQHPDWNTAEKVDGHDKNYLAKKEIDVPDNNRRLRDTLTLYSAHIDVAVEIYGLERQESKNGEGFPYELTFEKANAQTSFNNNIKEAGKETCSPELIYDEKYKCYRTNNLALFRMDKDGQLNPQLCEHVLLLKEKNTGNELARIDIYDYLNKNSEYIDVTKQEALLPISIKFNSIGVTIGIPEWVIEDIKPEF